jgi:murein DD-endopeptidase MepM/ murein hydrolase activator NlpD
LHYSETTTTQQQMNINKRSITTVSFVVILLCFFTKSIYSADNVYAGIWISGSDGQKLVTESSWGTFVSLWQSYHTQSYRLVDIKVYRDVNDGQLKYHGVYRPGTWAHALYSYYTWDGFVAKWRELGGQGFRLTNIETFVDGGVRKFAGVWQAGSGGYALWGGYDWAGFVAKWQELAPTQRLIDVAVYLDTNNVVKYIGVWRSGSGAYYLWNAQWDSFRAKWQELAQQGLLLKTFKTYVNAAGQRYYIGIWGPGSGGYYLWINADKENFLGKYHQLESQNLRLIGIETYTGSNQCSNTCTNQVNCGCPGYNYLVTGDSRWYRWPTDVVGSDKFARLSALDATAKIFKLPFSDTRMRRVNGWLYGAGAWHLGVDYSFDGKTSIQVKSAAAGVVEFFGWDNWSGNTIIIRHDSSEGSDTYRTIYMHLRNGPLNDCAQAWTATVPTLTGDTLTKYKDHLTATGCTQNVATRNPNVDHWGTNAQKVTVTRGQFVSQGQVIANTGQTGPGGVLAGGGGTNTNNHLHMFFTRKDPTNNEFYFVDPYGIYGQPSCYPSNTIGSLSGLCVRYPILWQNSQMQYS